MASGLWFLPNPMRKVRRWSVFGMPMALRMGEVDTALHAEKLEILNVCLRLWMRFRQMEGGSVRFMLCQTRCVFGPLSVEPSGK